VRRGLESARILERMLKYRQALVFRLAMVCLDIACTPTVSQKPGRARYDQLFCCPNSLKSAWCRIFADIPSDWLRGEYALWVCSTISRARQRALKPADDRTFNGAGFRRQAHQLQTLSEGPGCRLTRPAAMLLLPVFGLNPGIVRCWRCAPGANSAKPNAARRARMPRSA